MLTLPTKLYRPASKTIVLAAGLALAPLGFEHLAQAAHQDLSSTTAGPTVTVEDLDGTEILWSVADLAGQTWTEDTAQIIFDGRQRQKLQSWGAAAFEVSLHSGDRILGSVASGSEESLLLELIDRSRAEFSIEEIGSIYSLGSLADRGALGAPESGDRLWRITSGGFDPLDGFLLGFDEAGVTMEGDLGTRTAPWDEVACLWIEAIDEVPSGSRSKDENGRQPVAVDMVDGSRLRGHFAGLTKESFSFQRPSKQTLHLGLDSIMRINLDDQRQVFLSDLKWREAESRSLFGDEFGMHWPALADHSVTGERLRSGGEVWLRGLGVHAPSSLEFDAMDGGILRGSVAIDDSVLPIPARGSVVFHVVLDGVTTWSSPEMTSGDVPIRLPGIPLGEAEVLELRVDEASDSFIGDRANWLGIRIVKP
jgi:hypothetical protein